MTRAVDRADAVGSRRKSPRATRSYDDQAELVGEAGIGCCGPCRLPASCGGWSSRPSEEAMLMRRRPSLPRSRPFEPRHGERRADRAPGAVRMHGDAQLRGDADARADLVAERDARRCSVAPVARRRAAREHGAGTTWMPGWPRAYWLPSSSSSIVPAVPLTKAAMLRRVRLAAGPMTAHRRCRRVASMRAASACISGSCAPAAMAPMQSQQDRAACARRPRRAASSKRRSAAKPPSARASRGRPRASNHGSARADGPASRWHAFIMALYNPR